MKIDQPDAPRRFTAGRNAATVADCGRIRLDAGEQVTFVTDAGSEYDVARQTWGFYAMPSLNVRLPGHGLRPVLVRNAEGRYYLLLVERGKDEEFERFLQAEAETVICWLDDTTVLETLSRAATENRHA
ncbi:unnamed protein product [uncultured bacterium]|nr:unnamed protein product [uncultured bacterium]